MRASVAPAQMPCRLPCAHALALAPIPARLAAPSRLFCEQMHLVRGVTGKQFSDALDENLRPIMA